MQIKKRKWKIHSYPRLGIIQRTLVVIMLVAMSLVWPAGAFPVVQHSGSDLTDYRISNLSNETEFVRQEFSPTFENLKSISVYICNNPDSVDTMKAVFRLYDYTGTCLLESFFQVEELTLPGYVVIPVELKLTPGTLYYYTIGGVDGDLLVAYCSDPAKAAENGAFYYKEVPSGGTSVATEYCYERPMGLKRILFADGLLLLAAALLLWTVAWLRSSLQEKTWRKAEKWVRVALQAACGAFVVFTFVTIMVFQLVGEDMVNAWVLWIGCVIAAVALGYGIHITPSDYEPLEEGELTLQQKGIHLLRAGLWAAAILFCCLHTNAMTDYEKGLHIRSLLVCVSLLLVSYGKKKEIFNLPNLLWTAAAFGFGKYYISLHADHIEHITTATHSAWVIWGIGLSLIQLVYSLGKGNFRKLKQLRIPYAFVWLLLAAGCMIFSNGKSWPWLFFVVMTLWYIKYLVCEDREYVLSDMTDGFLLAFAAGTLFCLYRRPYQYFMLSRYGGIFYTSTATALFLLIPICAALEKCRKAGKDKGKLLSGLTLLGMSVSYLCFTASRTGILAMLAVFFFFLLVPGMGEKARKAKQVAGECLKRLGLLIVTVILGFLVTFSAQRMLPAVIANPFYFFYEQEYAYIEKDTGFKGEFYHRYITIQKAVENFFGRMLIQDYMAALDGTEEFCVPGGFLAAAKESSQSVADALPEEEEGDYSNGRLEIFDAYLKQMNLTGHTEMGLEDEHGEYIVHAHNSYLQMAYDFGIPVGIYFLFVCAVMFLKSLFLAWKKDGGKTGEALPLFIVVAFGVSSLVEWVFYPTIALGFALLAVQAPLLKDPGKGNVSGQI